MALNEGKQGNRDDSYTDSRDQRSNRYEFQKSSNLNLIIKDVLQVFDYSLHHSSCHGYRIVFSIIPIDFAPMMKVRGKFFPFQVLLR
jgi:hypothetical protein